MDVFEIIKAKVPADKLPDDMDLAMRVAEVGQSILTYCNRTDIPPDLVFVHANMVVDTILGDQRKLSDTAQPAVKSIKEGDVQVTFEASKATGRELSAEAVLHGYTHQLNRHRKVRR